MTTEPAETFKQRLPRYLRRSGIVLAALILVGTPWWGPRLLSSFDFFHVRRIEFDGLRYTDPAELIARLSIDTLASVWMDLDPLAERVSEHPMVLGAEVQRRLPSTLYITVRERTPVALVPGERHLVPVDSAGQSLPIDPSVTPVDVPVVAVSDTVVLRLLAQIRAGAPELWARLSTAQRENDTDLQLRVDETLIRTRDNVTLARLADILPVEADLARRRLQAVELDLRFRDQVIARLP